MIFCGSDSEFYFGKVLVPVQPPVLVPECITVPVPLRQKVAVPAVPVPAPVPKHSL
jgi:hypothetical protein